MAGPRVLTPLPSFPRARSLSLLLQMSGTVPGIVPGTKLSALSYDYEGKMMKHEYPSGKQSVYRFDQKVPGESWSRAYVWTTGKEATCCFVNLCRMATCQPGEQSRMNKIQVDSAATDAGPAGASSERYHHATPVIFGSSSVGDWIVDRNSSAITKWTNNVTVKSLWAASASTYGGLVIGNLTAADFAYPRMCFTNVCDADDAAQALAVLSV